MDAEKERRHSFNPSNMEGLHSVRKVAKTVEPISNSREHARRRRELDVDSQQGGAEGGGNTGDLDDLAAHSDLTSRLHKFAHTNSAELTFAVRRIIPPPFQSFGVDKRARPASHLHVPPQTASERPMTLFEEGFHACGTG